MCVHNVRNASTTWHWATLRTVMTFVFHPSASSLRGPIVTKHECGSNCPRDTAQPRSAQLLDCCRLLPACQRRPGLLGNWLEKRDNEPPTRATEKEAKTVRKQNEDGMRKHNREYTTQDDVMRCAIVYSFVSLLARWLANCSPGFAYFQHNWPATVG